MNTNFQEVSEVTADERFLSWYFRDNQPQGREWKTMMDSDHSLSELSQEASEFLDQLPRKEIPMTRQQVEVSLAALRAKLNAAPVVTMRPRRTWLKIAAAAAVLAIAGFFVFRNTEEPCNIKAEYGQLSTNQLPDGSTLILNANSTASLSTDWKGKNDREVWLEGEGFFKVAKTPEKKRFIVHTGNLDVIVTGTQFNVSNRDKRTTVLLTEGSVTIRTKDGREVKMKPGDFVEMTNEQLVPPRTVIEDNILAWKDNRMGFDSTSMEDVARIIRNHYGVKVVLGDDSVRSQSVTGVMKNNNLDELLKAIEMTVGVTITRTNDQITISSNMQ
ncbi:MAG: DUF4974 domain-containing protein [Chitinophagaceae bacterium]|nr:MAG: DUF4974 domain-containing protein [Chitinophagaceae bacterium]